MTAPLVADPTPERPKATGAFIQLQNPVATQFDAFIFQNATVCDHVAVHNSAQGQHLIICGAGPSLAEHAAEWCPQGDQVWGCNSALTYLADRGHRVTHGFTVDQTPAMVAEWRSCPDVEYLVASSVHPHLVDYLMHRKRPVRFFHNFVGIQKDPVPLTHPDGREEIVAFEDYLYRLFYPQTVVTGAGLNAVTRAIDLARYMGFDKVTVLGADCALRTTSREPEGVSRDSRRYRKWLEREVTMHADGGNALASGATACVMGADIDGRYWLTKPDMSITAQWLVRMRRAWPEHLTLIGDTFPNAIRDKDDAFLDRLPNFVTPDGRVVPVPTLGPWSL